MDIVIVVMIFVLLGFVGYLCEKKSWNGGYCPKCHHAWEQFDTDSQGGRGYSCQCEKNSVWVSWLWEKPQSGIDPKTLNREKRF